MRPSLIRSRLSHDKAVRIACMYYANTMMPAHAANAGYDAIWLDTEHNTWDRHELQRMIAMHHLANIDCIVRTGSRNPHRSLPHYRRRRRWSHDPSREYARRCRRPGIGR